MHCFSKGHDALQATALQVLCDIFTTHPSLLSLQSSNAALQKSIFKAFGKGLKATHSPEVQGAATIAVCKQLLTGVIQDEDLLKQTIMCYFDPATRENAVVRQALSYFLPVYTNSRRENMERMATVAPGVLHAMLSLEEGLDEEEEMVGIGVVGNMLVDWTDARKLVVQDEVQVGWDEAGRREAKPINGDIHLDLAANLLAKVMSNNCTSRFRLHPIFGPSLIPHSGEERKVMMPLLGKLYVTAHSSAEKLQMAHDLAVEAIDMNIAFDAASRNGLNKFHAALIKVMGESSMDKKQVDGETIADMDSKMEVGDADLNPPGLKIEVIKTEKVSDTQDSLLEELLAEEEEI